MSQNETNIRTINAAIQNEGLSWQAGSTTLASLPRSEQRKYLGLLADEEERRRLSADRQQREIHEQQRRRAEAFAAPAAIDWRNNAGNYVTPVKNQGGCGSCVSFCTCSVIESAFRIKLQNPNYNIDLSEGFLQFCGGGSCNGWGLTSGLDFAQSTGVTDEACMPYQATDMNCAAKRCSDWQNRLTKITSYTGHATMAARKEALATSGPVVAGMAVFDDFFAYTSGIYQKTAGSQLSGYHCISVVGYNDSQQCWILKNSWGTGWGESGFCRMKYGQADLLIDTSWMFYSVVVPVQTAGWHSNIAVTQTYASRDSQNAHAYFQGLGWRRIQPGSPDAVTNMLMIFAQAVARNKLVTIYADADFVYEAYMS